MKRFIFSLWLGLSVVVVVFAIGLLVYIHTPYGRSVEFTLEPGMTLNQVIDRLAENGVLSNQPLFKIYVVAQRLGEKIRAGEYRLDGPVSPHELLNLLLKGDFARLRITVPEGRTVRELADQLGQLGLLDPNLFLQKANDPTYLQTFTPRLGFEITSLEGLLFPDTYEIYKPKGPEEVIGKMVEKFKEIFAEETRSAPHQTGFTPYQLVVLASLVEKETGRPEERPLIASVFFNRLKRQMALASDPAVIYGIRNFSGNLIRSDLERPGPYNTYLNPGLPPTPICNPGRASLHAVLHPAPTDFLYFVSRNDGSHEFSKTLEEHSRAVSQYQISQGATRQEKSPTARTAPR